MMGRQGHDQTKLFYEFCLEDRVPADHLLRKIDRFLDLSTLRQGLTPFYSPIGRPSIDPELMIRMLVVGYCFGIRSERRLCEEVDLNLAYRWFCRWLWCKRQDLARYDVGRAAGGVGMSKLMGVEQLFEGRHFDREVIILCVRWYLRFKLSLRDLVEMMAERGLSLAHTTIMRWVWRYAPEFEKRWKRFAQAVGRSWRVDETYVKIRGEWCYLYPAMDRAGRTVDFRLSAKRDVAAAKAFFRKAIKGQHDAPRTITLDGYAASHRAVRELKADGLLPAETKLRSSKYLNNLIEQDHRGVKQRIATMLGFKGFATASITIAGIELMHRIRKGQFGLGGLGVQGRLAPAVWNAVLQA